MNILKLTQRPGPEMLILALRSEKYSTKVISRYKCRYIVHIILSLCNLCVQQRLARMSWSKTKDFWKVVKGNLLSYTQSTPLLAVPFIGEPGRHYTERLGRSALNKDGFLNLRS
jgi:hypothetical protein